METFGRRPKQSSLEKSSATVRNLHWKKKALAHLLFGPKEAKLTSRNVALMW